VIRSENKDVGREGREQQRSRHNMIVDLNIIREQRILHHDHIPLSVITAQSNRSPSR
jgi:hypothetical protein